METKWGSLWYIRVGDSFSNPLTARKVADEYEVLYDLSCVVDKVRTRWYIFARGPTYHLIKEGGNKTNENED